MMLARDGSGLVPQVLVPEDDKPERAQHLPRNVAMLEQAVRDRSVDQAHLEG
jgi:hypothetical protein